MRSSIVQIFLMLMLSLPAKAGLLDNYNVRYYMVEDGLCDQNVLSTFRDSRGFEWISTSNGLDRFDGRDFIHFSTHSSQSATRLANDFVYGVSEDSCGRIWAISDGGLFCIGPESSEIRYFEGFIPEFNGMMSRSNSAIVKSRGDSFWVAGSGRLMHFSVDASGDPVDLVRSASLRGLMPGSLCVQGNQVWMGGFAGVRCFSLDQSGQIQEVPVSAGEELSSLRGVSAICANGSILWLGSFRGLFRMDLVTGILSQVSHGPVTNLALMRTGDVVAGMLDGLHCFSALTLEETDRVGSNDALMSLNSSRINHIRVEDNGQIWVGTTVGGANVLTPRKITVQSALAASSGDGNIVSSVIQDDSDNLLALVQGRGLAISYSGSPEFTFVTEGISDVYGGDGIFSLCQDYRGDYWFTTRNGNLLQLCKEDLRAPRFRTVVPDIQSGMPGFLPGFMSNLVSDPARHGLWLCAGNAVMFYDIENDRFIRAIEENLGNRRLQAGQLYLDGQNRLWVGGRGLCVIDLSNRDPVSGSFSYAVFGHGLIDGRNSESDWITSFCETRSGDIYIGTRNSGVIKVSQPAGPLDLVFTPMPINNGEFYSGVSKLLKDSRGDLWIGTNTGVFHYDTGTHYLTRFTSHDGMSSDQCFMSSGCQLSNGGICFGTSNGVVIFPDPLESARHYERRVLITSVENGGLNIGHAISAIDVYPDNPVFEIRFSALDQLYPDDVTYAYRLDELGEEWTLEESSSYCRYSNLKPGSYTFRIRCTNLDGTWSESDTLLAIKVHPKFYQTWAFPVVLVLSFLLLVAAVIFQYVNSQRRIRRQLEEQVEERTRGLVEAQRERQLLYANLTHELKTPLTLIAGPVRTLKDKLKGREGDLGIPMQIVERNVDNMISLVNQLLEVRTADDDQMALNFETIDLRSMLDAFQMDYSGILSQRSITYSTLTRLPGTSIVSDKDKVGKILTNLISNAVKYSPDAGSISVRAAKVGETTLFLSVSNTGSYIDEAECGKIFDCFYKGEGRKAYPIYGQSSTGIGLYLVRKLVNGLGGSISVKSSLRAGTDFRVLLPVTFVTDTPDVQASNFGPVPESGSSVPVLLLAEDNDDMRTFIRSLLEDRYAVVEAADGNIGFALAKKVNPDFIISDLMMPVCDGVEFCRKVRRDSTLSHVPFLMLTAMSGDDSRLGSYSVGVDAFLTKPFNPDVLTTRIASILASRRDRQAALTMDITSAFDDVLMEDPDTEFMDRLRSVLKARYSDSEFGASALQAEMGMSAPPFYKKISTLTGLTPAHLIRLYRLQTAQKMLEAQRGKGSMSVSEVAYAVGFNDPKYFSKCYVAQFGELPSTILQPAKV